MVFQLFSNGKSERSVMVSGDLTVSKRVKWAVYHGNWRSPHLQKTTDTKGEKFKRQKRAVNHGKWRSDHFQKYKSGR